MMCVILALVASRRMMEGIPTSEARISSPLCLSSERGIAGMRSSQIEH